MLFLIKPNQQKMQNLGFLTDFKLLGADSEIIEYADYFLVKTPSNPTFIDGNCMVLKTLELLQDKVKLEAVFKAHFKMATQKHHLSFKLMDNLSEDLLKNYLKDKYLYDRLAVMTYVQSNISAPVYDENKWVIRPFLSELDWEKWAENEIKERPTIFSKASFQGYLIGRMEVYKQLNKQGFGNFYGVFQEEDLLSSAGLYIFDGIGRFQQVRTIEHARRQGMCNALIQSIYKSNETKMKAAVIVADEAYHALKLYEGLGFRSKQNQYDLTKVLAH